LLCAWHYLDVPGRVRSCAYFEFQTVAPLVLLLWNPACEVREMSAAVLSANRDKRPLELNNSDDETENEEQPAAKATAEKQAEIEAEELVVKKKARHSKPFTEDLLTLPDGLQRIYEEFPSAAQFRGRGSEGKDIKRLLGLYREWAFQLHAGMASSDVIAKCEVLGTRGKTRSCLQSLRERERSRYIVSIAWYNPPL
jgi:hypothetical protein